MLSTPVRAIGVLILTWGAVVASAQPLFPEFRRPPEGREKLPTLPSVLVDQDGHPIADPGAWRDARAHLRRRWVAAK